MTPPMKDYAMTGDCKTAALVGRDAIKLPRHRRSRVRREMLCLACCLGIALIGGCGQKGTENHSLLPVKVQPVKLVTYAPRATLTGEIAARVQSELSFALADGLSNVRWKLASTSYPGRFWRGWTRKSRKLTLRRKRWRSGRGSQIGPGDIGFRASEGAA